MSTYVELQDQVIEHQLNDTKYRPSVKRWLNEAQARIVRQADIRTQYLVTEIAYTGGTSNMPLPSDYARLIEVADSTADADWSILEPMGMREFDEAPNASGVPTAYLVVGQLLYLYPTPDTDANVALSYWRMATDMAADGDEPEIPSDFHYLLVYYALMRCFQRENDYDAALYWQDQWETQLLKLRTELQYDTADPPKIVPGTWGDLTGDANKWY